MARRSATPGHIRKREGKRGTRDEYFFDAGVDPVTGKRRQITKGGFTTRREAQQALTEALRSVQQGAFVARTKLTRGDYLEGEWLPAIRATVRPTTWEHYAGNVRAHIVPRLGAVSLADLSPAQLNAFYAELLASGRRQRAGGLSPKTVRHVHTLLRKALQDAVRWGRVVRNVADQADPPRPPATEMKVWTPDQLRSFLSSVREERLYPLWRLMAMTGMRRGEVLGLRWRDLDLEAARLSVVSTRVARQAGAAEPKTRKGRRSIALDAGTVAALREHRRRQVEERLVIGPGFNDENLVFIWADGRPYRPEWLSREFERVSRLSGLPRIRLHDVRHSYATAALAAGIPAKVVSERLGHAQVSITLDTYSHVLPSLDESAADRVASLILGP